MARGKLCANVTEHFCRNAHVRGKKSQKSFVDAAVTLQTQWRDAQSFLINLGGIAAIAASDATTVVPPGSCIMRDDLDNLIVEVGAA